MLSNITAGAIVGTAITRLLALRTALEDIADLQASLSEVSATELDPIFTNAGMTSSDVSAVLSAVADANALTQIYNTGLPPSSYPQPPSAYPYAASQRAVIGPQ
jgi:hypothetical protein